MSQDANHAAGEAGALLGRIGQLTRQLREGLRELGLDKHVAMAAEAIPDARDRLTYVATMTERAAERALNAIDIAQPMQEQLAAGARQLHRRWSDCGAVAALPDEAQPLLTQTLAYLEEVPRTAAAINAQLIEIMMAQDFQDLTGQVIKKMMDVIGQLESQLLQVLIDHSAKGGAAEAGTSLQNGPQVRVDPVSGVANQAQVDDLLESLGF